jgi:hypothetical protein
LELLKALNIKNRDTLDKHKLPEMVNRWSTLIYKERIDLCRSSSSDNETSQMKGYDEAFEIKRWVEQLLENLVEKAVKISEKEIEKCENLANDVKSKADNLYKEWKLIKVNIKDVCFFIIYF